MKKLLLLGVLALGAIAANAKLTVTVEGQPIENGSTVTSTNLITLQQYDDYDDVYYDGWQIYPEVVVTSTTDTQLTVNMTNKSTEYIPGVQICWPSNCMPCMPGQTTPVEGSLKANVPTDLNIDTSEWYEYDNVSAFSRTAVIVMMASSGDSFNFTLIMTYDPEQNGVDDIVSENATPVYYDLNGRRVANPERGIYIVKQGAKVSKQVIR